MIVTFLATLLLCLVAVIVLMFTQKGRYRASPERIIRLLEWMLLGQADENDWEVFCGLPILHDDFLESIRQACAEIAEDYPRASSRSIYLLTDEGLDKLRPLLEDVRCYKRQLDSEK